MHTIDSLGLSRWVELRLHDVDLVCRGEIESETARTDRDKNDADVRVVGEGIEGFVAVLALHAAVKADMLILEAMIIKSDLDEVEVSCPAREDDTGI